MLVPSKTNNLKNPQLLALDLLVGYSLSPILWKHISANKNNKLSAGRCQTPALRLIYDNQQEINNAPGRIAYDTSGYFTDKNLELNLIQAKDKILGYKWNNRAQTIQMLGRFQPWHYGHRTLFEKCILKTGQVNILVKDVHKVGDNPFNFKQVKEKILHDLKNFKSRIRVTLVPNISEICYGRTVGYKIIKINLNKKIESISATKIRKKLRIKGLLKKS